MHLTNVGLSYILVFVFEAQYRHQADDAPAQELQPEVRDALSRTNKQKGYMKKLKEEYQPGGSKRHEIITKAVTYLKDPRFGLQADKKFFLLEQVGLTTLEYLEALNRAAAGDAKESEYWQSE